jgi:ribosome-associated translation inhibitor RaiA
MRRRLRNGNFGGRQNVIEIKLVISPPDNIYDNPPIMHIEVNTDNNIEGSARMTAYFTETLEEALRRFEEQISRVQVHLSDENGQKQGSDDKRCLLEARLKGLKPVVVSHQAENIDIAVSGAIDKLIKSLDNTIGKLRDQ